jgi:hypothetical protein
VCLILEGAFSQVSDDSVSCVNVDDQEGCCVFHFLYPSKNFERNRVSGGVDSLTEISRPALTQINPASSKDRKLDANTLKGR